MRVRDICESTGYNTNIILNVCGHYISIDKSNKEEILNIYGDLKVMSIEVHPYRNNTIIVTAD